MKNSSGYIDIAGETKLVLLEKDEQIADLRAENKRLRKVLGDCERAARSLAPDALGQGNDGESRYYYRDELLSRIGKLLGGESR